MNIGWMWKAVVAGLGAAITSVTAIEASGAMTWESLAIALFGAVGTGLATFAKANAPGAPESQSEAITGKPEVVSQQIPAYAPEPAAAVQFAAPDGGGLPTAFPQ